MFSLMLMLEITYSELSIYSIVVKYAAAVLIAPCRLALNKFIRTILAIASASSSNRQCGGASFCNVHIFT
jgi:hypothetical protein